MANEKRAIWGKILTLTYAVIINDLMTTYKSKKFVTMKKRTNEKRAKRAKRANGDFGDKKVL
jgi:hypothetical protein